MSLIIRIMQAISYLTATLVTVFLPLVLIGGGTVDYSFGDGDKPFVIRGEAGDLGSDPSLWAYLWLVLGGAMFAYAFYRLGRLFGLFAKRRYFSSKGVQHMRVFAGIYLTLGLVNFVETKYEIYRGGDRADLWNISGEDIVGVMLSLTFLIIAHVLNEARKKNEELDNYF